MDSFGESHLKRDGCQSGGHSSPTLLRDRKGAGYSVWLGTSYRPRASAHDSVDGTSPPTAGRWQLSLEWVLMWHDKFGQT